MDEAVGRRVVRRRPDGLWASNVWIGGHGVAYAAWRYVYKTRAQARKSDVFHEVGERGRVAATEAPLIGGDANHARNFVLF
jgi:hypothetical protein